MRRRARVTRPIQQSLQGDRRIARWLTVFAVVASALTGLATYFASGVDEGLIVAGISLVSALVGVYIFKRVVTRL